MKKRKYIVVRKTLCQDFCFVEASSKEEALNLVDDTPEWHHDSVKTYPWKAKLDKGPGK